MCISFSLIIFLHFIIKVIDLEFGFRILARASLIANHLVCCVVFISNFQHFIIILLFKPVICLFYLINHCSHMLKFNFHVSVPNYHF